MRSYLTSVAEFVSAGCVIAGVAQINSAAAWITGGAFGLWFARAAAQ